MPEDPIVGVFSAQQPLRLALFFRRSSWFGRADRTLTVRYVGCTGMSGSPSPLPAGSYSVLVYDDDNCNASFTLTGPGVSLSSDLNSTGMGIDHPAGPFGPYNFQAGSTYTARDSSINASAQFTPTAAAAGGSSGGSGGSSGGSSGSGGSSSGGSGGRRVDRRRPSARSSARQPHREGHPEDRRRHRESSKRALPTGKPRQDGRSSRHPE
jgi:uncharacterized membrane protein YgcG